MTPADVVGDIGVAHILGTYLAAQTDRMNPRGDVFLILNGWGSALVLYSLFHHYNQSAFVIQCAWIAISVVGIIRNALQRRKRRRLDGCKASRHRRKAGRAARTPLGASVEIVQPSVSRTLPRHRDLT